MKLFFIFFRVLYLEVYGAKFLIQWVHVTIIPLCQNFIWLNRTKILLLLSRPLSFSHYIFHDSYYCLDPSRFLTTSSTITTNSGSSSGGGWSSFSQAVIFLTTFSADFFVDILFEYFVNIKLYYSKTENIELHLLNISVNEKNNS